VCTAYRLLRRSPSVNLHPSSDVLLLSLPMWPLPPPFLLLPLFSYCLFPVHCSFPSAAFFPNTSPYSPTAHCSATVPCSTVPFAPMPPATPIVVADGADADGEGSGALHVLISLFLLRSGFWGAVRVGWRGAGEEREEVGRGCTTPSQRALQNHKRRFFFLQRIQLVRPCTTALQLASRIRPLIEYESSPGTLAIVAPRGAT